MLTLFIHRPILVGVIALVIITLGVVAMVLLPIARYPNIAPPQVQVSAQFTGGDAVTVADAIATPLEQAVNGADGLIYIESTSSSDGQAILKNTFAIGTDIDIAAVDVLTRVNQARPQLPAITQDRGVTIEKASPQLTAVLSLNSPDNSRDELFLSNYATINIVDRLSRIPGVGRTINFTRQDYAIRIWLDPEQMRYYQLDPREVVAAVQAQNAAVAAGTIGQTPTTSDQVRQLQVKAQGRLERPEQFGDIILRTLPDGGVVRVEDIGYVELGAQSYGSAARFSKSPSAQIGIFQSPDANSLQLLQAIRAEMEQLEGRFPSGVAYSLSFDTTRFVEASIRGVVWTLLQAVVLVVLVVYLFLQKLRTTFIPIVVIPAALIGSFGLMFALGFSINQLTLLGLILAVGLVVDDAIVVVENVERNLESGRFKNAKAATEAAMKEVISPIVATTAVLFALFVPVSFAPGITGLLYNQFSLTVAIAVGLSSLFSLTLTPALCGVMLKPAEGDPPRPFRWFNSGFAWSRRRYSGGVDGLLQRRWMAAAIYGGLLVVTLLLFLTRPTGFVPEEDQGYFVVNIELPSAASFQRTREVVFELEEQILATPGVADTVAIAGRSFIADVNASYYGFIIPVLAPWSERDLSQNSAAQIIERLNNQLRSYPHAKVQVLNAPPIPGIGSTGSVRLQLQALEQQSPEALAAIKDRFLAAANKRPEVQAAFSTYSADVPQLFFDIDRDRAEQYGVPVENLFDAIQIYLGSAFINEFNRFGRTYRVFAQGVQEARDEATDLSRLAVKNLNGEMVPLNNLVSVRFDPGPQAIQHYNLYPTASINAQPTPGYSSGQLTAALEAVADKVLSSDVGYEWTGVVYQQQQGVGWTPIIFALAIGLVFLVLAAQFESLAVPLVVILAVPLAMIGALGLLALAGLELDVFGQIGLLMLIGLSAKNAILIVQFAEGVRQQGKAAVAAATEAARLRLRPILMTAISFILGALPLALASGAGANARISLGVTVIGGMIAATLLSLLLVPICYVMVAERQHKEDEAAEEAATSA